LFSPTEPLLPTELSQAPPPSKELAWPGKLPGGNLLEQLPQPDPQLPQPDPQLPQPDPQQPPEQPAELQPPEQRPPEQQPPEQQPEQFLAGAYSGFLAETVTNQLPPPGRPLLPGGRRCWRPGLKQQRSAKGGPQLFQEPLGAEPVPATRVEPAAASGMPAPIKSPPAESRFTGPQRGEPAVQQPQPVEQR